MLGFVVDTARDSSSVGKHRSGLDSGVPFSVNNMYRRRAYPTAGKDRQDDQKRMKGAWPDGKAQVRATRQRW